MAWRYSSGKLPTTLSKEREETGKRKKDVKNPRRPLRNNTLVLANLKTMHITPRSCAQVPSTKGGGDDRGLIISFVSHRRLLLPALQENFVEIRTMEDEEKLSGNYNFSSLGIIGRHPLL